MNCRNTSVRALEQTEQIEPCTAPRAVIPGDLEAQHFPNAMIEISGRNNSRSRFVHPLNPVVPSLLNVAGSPSQYSSSLSSSRYSVDGPPSRKSPQPGPCEQLPASTRWRVPNSPPTRPATDVESSRSQVITELGATAPAEHVQGHGVRSQGAFAAAAVPEVQIAEDCRQTRERHQASARRTKNRPRRLILRDNFSAWRSNRHRQRKREEELDRRRQARKPLPKHFLFCFPWIKSRHIRNLVLQCFVTGLLLALVLTVYLALSITRNINSSDFIVLLFLIIFFFTLFFCHVLIRLFMAITQNSRNRGSDETHHRCRISNMAEPGVYAVPCRPIPVVLARDQEAAGLESDTATVRPPPYGLWRESVRVDPNRIYWAPASMTASDTNLMGRISNSSSNDLVAGPEALLSSPRPPSYVSEDGVSYVVEARPRSTVPSFDAPLALHTVEDGRRRRAER